MTPSTVSRALARSPLVKEETRFVVLAKAKSIGYERNMMASNLRKAVVKTVGIIVPRINRQFFSNVISGAESVLNDFDLPDYGTVRQRKRGYINPYQKPSDGHIDVSFDRDS